MTVRHFAYFADTGRADGKFTCVRDMKGPVPAPDIDPRLTGDARLQALNAWQQRVAPADPHEIGLDITRVDKPVGAVRYWLFDPVARRTEEGPMRSYVQIDVATLTIVALLQSPQPIEAPADRLILDVTDTAIEPYLWELRGRFTSRAGTWALEADAIGQIAPPPALDPLVAIMQERDVCGISK